MPGLALAGIPLLHGMIGQPLIGSGRGCDPADDDEEYGNTPRRDTCDYSVADGQCSGEQLHNFPPLEIFECPFANSAREEIWSLGVGSPKLWFQFRSARDPAL